MDLFSTAAEHIFEHPELEEVQPVAGPSSNGDAAGGDIEEAFEVADTVRRIVEGGYKTIGLQFPDELLPSSVPVFRAVQKGIAHTGAQAYVLGDSTYGSCCPDILSCLHLPADYLVHYGHACLTPTDAIPVHYVFPRKTLDVQAAGASFLSASQEEIGTSRKGVVVVWDVAYNHAASELISNFTTLIDVPVTFAAISQQTSHRMEAVPVDASAPKSPRQQAKSPESGHLRSIAPPEGLSMADCALWYIGEEGRGLMNLQMQNADSSIYHYSPTSGQTTPVYTSRLLQRRLLSIHTAVASDVFGLVVHSVGLRSAQPLLAELRALLKQHRKKSYTLTVGRLNPAKLANFEAIECFVLVGCKEGGLVDSKDFLRPIITPWELLLALQGPEHAWEPGRWTLDIATVLTEARRVNPTKEANAEAAHANGVVSSEGQADSEDDEDAPVFSLATGAYKSRRHFGPRASADKEEAVSTDNKTADLAEGVQALAIRNNEYTLAKLESAGSHYLTSRHFQGLEVREGMDEPAVLEEGRGGIARGYTEER